MPFYHSNRKVNTELPYWIVGHYCEELEIMSLVGGERNKVLLKVYIRGTVECCKENIKDSHDSNLEDNKFERNMNCGSPVQDVSQSNNIGN